MSLPFRAWGREGDPVLLMLHGMWGGSRHWARLVPFLEGWHAVAPELPGFPPEASPGFDYSPAAYARAVLDLMDDRGFARVVAVGNSLGGRVAVALAELAPGRVAGVVLAAPAGLTPAPTWLKALPKFRPPGPGEAEFDPSSFREMTFAQLFARPPGDPHIVPLIEAEREAHRGIPFRAFLEGSARCLTAMSRDVPDAARLGRIPVRGLIWGRDDRLIPLETADLLRAVWPGAPLEVLDRTGHLPELESPALFVAALGRCLESAPGSA